MRAAIAVVVALAGCGMSGGGGGGGGGSTMVSGNISSDTTWSGTVTVTAATTIQAGVTVTVAAGTTLDMAAGLTVDGTLDASAGTKTSPITIEPASGSHFPSTTISSGGMVVFSYVTQRGGGFQLSGTAMITDSSLSQASGDWMVINGGTLDMQYSEVGIGAPTDANAGNGDTTHCNFHVGSVGTITVNNTNIAGSPYGFMLYAPTTGTADLKNNNFYGNQYDFEPGEGGLGDVTGSWFKSGSITSGATGINGTLAAQPVAAGPR